MKSIIMQKLTKTIAALMLAIAVVCAAGCKKHNDGNGSYNGHDYIDLGLPSGTLWATCNVGADTPEVYGDFFAWGETQTKDVFDVNTYKYSNGDYYPLVLTKYCPLSQYGYEGFIDALTTLLPEDDAATANWGIGWCTPSETQWEELLENTTNEWTTKNGVKGRLFTSNNGTSLFLPATGYSDSGDTYQVESNGYYWTSTLDIYAPHRAKNFNFDSDNCHIGLFGRYQGQSIRPVILFVE